MADMKLSSTGETCQKDRDGIHDIIGQACLLPSTQDDVFQVIPEDSKALPSPPKLDENASSSLSLLAYR